MGLTEGLDVPPGLADRVVRLADLQGDPVPGEVLEGLELVNLGLRLLDLAGRDPEVKVVTEADHGADGEMVQGINHERVVEAVAVRRVGR